MPNNTPILQLMHDAVNPVNRIKQLVLLLKKKEEFSNEPMLDMIDKSADDLNNAIDAFYNTSKNTDSSPTDCVHPYDSVIQDENGHKCTKCGTQLTD